MVRDKASISIAIEWEYLASNEATAIVVRRDLGFHFQGHKFWNANIWKTARASEECSIMTFVDVAILRRMALRMF